MNDLRLAMALAEQTAKAASRTVASTSAEESLRAEIHCLRNQLSKVLGMATAQQSLFWRFPQPPKF